MSTDKYLTVDLLRHGVSVSNVMKRYSNSQNEKLSEIAHPQIEELKKNLYATNYNTIITSPYMRCIETAERLIGQKTFIIENKIREMALGPWDGLTEDEIKIIYPKEWKIWTQAPDKLDLNKRERICDVKDRVIPWFHNLIEANKGHILIVTHVVVIRVILSNILIIPLSEIRNIKVPNLKLYRLEFFSDETLVWEMQNKYSP